MKDDERLKNFILFKLYLTDSEIDDILPTAGVIILILVAAYGLFTIFF